MEQNDDPLNSHDLNESQSRSDPVALRKHAEETASRIASDLTKGAIQRENTQKKVKSSNSNLNEPKIDYSQRRKEKRAIVSSTSISGSIVQLKEDPLTAPTNIATNDIPKKSAMDIEISIDDLDEKNRHNWNRIDVSYLKDHTIPLADLILKYSTNVNTRVPLVSQGLSSVEVANRLVKYGPNSIPAARQPSAYIQFLRCITNLFNVLLFVAAAIYFIIFIVHPLDNPEAIWIGCTLIVVAFVNAGIEFYQIRQISTILYSFKSLVETTTTVIRDGKSQSINSEGLVPGDIVRLRPGDRAPTDLILFYASHLCVDSSSLSGESEPVTRSVKVEGCKKDVDAFDAPQFVFSSDLVISGEGFAIVVQTGKNSVMGQINKLSKAGAEKRSQLSVEIRRFIKMLSLLAVFTTFFFFFVALARGRNFNYAATFGIGIMLSWVPQGLPLTVTLILAISGSRMAKQNVIVKDLHGIETLGGITLLATDKTGTITKNQMQVTDIWTNNEFLYCIPQGQGPPPPLGTRPLKLDMSGIAPMLHVAVTCSTARREVAGSEMNFLGDATEVGLLRFASERLANLDKLGDLYPKVLEVPFSSETKFHLTIHRKAHQNGGLTLHIKGAPEIVWSLCSHIWIGNKPEQITESWKAKFETALKKYTSRGSRVLAMAMLQLPGHKYPDNYRFSTDKKNYPMQDLTFLGLVALEDPPKPEVNPAITQMRAAGIKVVMVTGDNAITAESVARQVNILTNSQVTFVQRETDLPVKPGESGRAIIITGNVVSWLSDSDWFHILQYEEIILARVSPAHKVELVKRAQALGHCVAVTGDGVNDGPALKKADLGISMNKTGSDITKESARMILLDDHFATIVTGIREGRLIFTNLKKATKYSLSHIIPEVLPYLLYVLVPIPLALNASQVLMVDLGFELLMTLSFAFENAEDEEILMKLPPRKPVTMDVASANFQSIMKKKEALTMSQSLNVLGRRPNEEDYMDSTMLLAEADDGNVAEEMKGLERNLRHRYLKYIKEGQTMLTNRDYWREQYREWKQVTEIPTGERLIDGEVMLWSFIEAGLIEFAGAICTYFAVFWFTFGLSSYDVRKATLKQSVAWRANSPVLQYGDNQFMSGETQYEALKQVQSAYFLSIFIIQTWNLFACKCRYTLPFGARVVSNSHTWLAIFAGVICAGIIVYTPVTNTIFQTSDLLHPVYFLIPLSFGALLYVYSVVRRVWLQNASKFDIIREKLESSPLFRWIQRK